MAIVKKYKPGQFCWADLGTTDVAAAKKFYRSIFGWSARDIPMGEGSVYSMLEIKGKEICALYPMDSGQKKAKVPPFWLPYIAVANVDRTVKKAKAAGAILCLDPHDVPGAGRMAILQDPTGARFAIWQARGNIGTKLSAVPGTVGWHDLSTAKTAAAAKFYAKVFGWKVKTMDFSGNSYYMLKLGNQGLGGIWPQPLPNHLPAWFTYWFVKSCARTVAKAKRLRGKVVLGPITVPETCQFAIIRDPQGAAFGVLEPIGRSRQFG
jgi:predicted enzyme related to lactoylglutathione lyase